MGLHVVIENARMEELPHQPFDVVTARACAPLPQLLEYAHSFVGPNTVCLFLKGQNVGSELTEATRYWNMKTSQLPSQTDPSAAIVEVRELGPRHVKSSKKTAHHGRRQPEGRRR
jgi:16S rRNA (guanine527-N7)-methyltransferase